MLNVTVSLRLGKNETISINAQGTSPEGVANKVVKLKELLLKKKEVK